MKFWTIIIPAALALLLGACGDWDAPAAARARRAAEGGDIVIGAAWPFSGGKGELWQGIELAGDELNAAGGVLGRKLRIVKADDESSLAKGRLVAQQFAEDRDMVAVIGHLNSYIALPASSIYQGAGLVYLTPGASSYRINDQGFALCFRSTPSNRSIGRRMAEDVAAQGHKRVAVYYVKDTNSQNMANYFEQRAQELGLSIVDRRAYLHGSRDFGEVIRNWRDLYQFDALFLAASMPESGHIIAQARELGLRQPIFGSEGIDDNWLMQVAGAAAEGVRLPEFVVRDEANDEYRRFSALYQRRYGAAPSAIAAQGYDSLRLLAQAIGKAGSSAPERIAAALHATRGWRGATGEYSFEANGDIPRKHIAIKMVRDGRFATQAEAAAR